MNIVVIMLENRSFDSFLGYLYSPDDPPQRNIPPLGPNEPPFHGLKFIDTAQFANTFVVDGQTLLSQPPVPSVRATNSPGSDPGEEYEHVCQQLFGSYDPPPKDKPATMAGFLQDYGNEWLNSQLDHAELDTISQIMHMYTPADLPVLNRLARAYAVSDMWFASVPTQTNANRAFSICGTSMGLVNNGFLSDNVVEAKLADDRFRTDTIWHVLERHAFHDWAVFWSDTYPPIISDVPYTRRVFPWLEQISNIDGHFRKMDDFFTMAEAGTLPAFSYLEPQWSGEILKLSVMGTEYHPPADVTPGEDTLRRIYCSLVKNQVAWQDTLLVITFDEHGGTYDHVPPPWGARPPWGNDVPAGLPLEKDFQFDRFGVRVPAIIVSPRIARGTVFRSPAQTPYDHTSVIATVLQLLLPDVPRTGWGLGDRVAHAPTFENVLTLQEPRQDDIFAPQAPPPVGTPLNYGDAFNLRHDSGERVTSAHSGIFFYFPTLSAEQPVRLDFRGGWGPVNSGAIVQIRTDEYLEPILRVEPSFIFAGIRNFLGAWKEGDHCYYYSTNDREDYGQQYWVITRADGSDGPVLYGDTVIIVSNFSDFKGQRLARAGGYLTTDASASDTWVIEPAIPDGEIQMSS